MTHIRGSDSIEIQLPDGSALRGTLNFTEGIAGRVPTIVFAHGSGSTRSGGRAATVMDLRRVLKSSSAAPGREWLPKASPGQV